MQEGQIADKLQPERQQMHPQERRGLRDGHSAARE
jgi:hypothetical protein